MKKISVKTSIFQEYYSDTPFYDRFAHNSKDAVDVIIPIIHTNELWDENLKSFYREIPVNRLLIGDGGCIDNSINIAKNFPRVKVLNHRKFKSLGFSIRHLIDEVKTEWFIYLHSDVYLPSGWFEKMKKHQPKYDWFGCPQRFTVLAEYDYIDPIRPYAGSQMGKKEAFVKGLRKIDDDYVYRQEDFVFNKIVEDNGFKTGKIEETFHYHQFMRRISPYERKIKNIQFDMEIDKREEIRSAQTQARGTVKYLDPDKFQQKSVEDNLVYLIKNKETTYNKFYHWVKSTNPRWVGRLNHPRITLNIVKDKLISKIKKGNNK